MNIEGIKPDTEEQTPPDNHLYKESKIVKLIETENRILEQRRKPGGTSQILKFAYIR